jgi:CelD/BcsL family acetyltransferase involved in cellulose biosynthesis
VSTIEATGNTIMDLQLFTTFPQDLAPEWNSLLAESIQHVPFLRHEYLETWWQTRGGGEWPPESQLAVVTARENGRLVGIAPMFFTPNWQGKSCLMLLGSHEVSDYLDFIARPESLPAFIESVLPFLTQEDLGIPHWQRLDVYNLLDSSPTLALLQAAAGKLGWKHDEELLQHSPYIPLPGDWEIYLAGIDKKQRHEIRRKMRRAETVEDIRWYVVSDAETLDAEIEDFMKLMEQDPDKARFLSPSMRDHVRLSVRCAFEAGCLCLAFLEIDGKKAAGYLSFDYLNRLWVYNSGINRDFMEYSPGWVLLGNLLKWSNEQGRTAFDFMRGDEEYKYRFGGVDRFVKRVKLDR